MLMADEWTIGRLLQWTTDYLKQHGSDSPRLDAEVLLAHARGCQRIELYTSFADPAADELRTAFRELVRRRAEGTPVAYLVGHREFYSLDFRVTPDVLIPRPETELLVMTALDLIKAARPRDGRSKWPTSAPAAASWRSRSPARRRRRASRPSTSARPRWPWPRDNAERLGVAERIEFVESDLFAAVPAGADVRLHCQQSALRQHATNWPTLPRDVKAYEPELALVGGPNRARASSSG